MDQNPKIGKLLPLAKIPQLSFDVLSLVVSELPSQVALCLNKFNHWDYISACFFISCTFNVHQALKFCYH